MKQGLQRTKELKRIVARAVLNPNRTLGQSIPDFRFMRVIG